jgi:mRNA-degrading endonuclease YafQ of YafQ-DinJ toxin-antitoxin module
MTIIYTPQFLRSYNKLNPDIKEIYKTKENIFLVDPFDTKLKTHKLKGTSVWSYSVTYKIRVLFLVEKEDVVLINIGDHSKYRNLKVKSFRSKNKRF